MRLLHVVTRDQRRGAETSAVRLSERLAARGHRSRVVALAAGPDSDPGLNLTVLGQRPLSPVTLLRLRREMRLADVVVAHGSKALPATGLASIGLRRPVVYQNIGDPEFWANSVARRARVRVMLHRMAAVAALTKRAAATINRTFDVPESSIRVIPNMRDNKHFRRPTPTQRAQARADLGLPEGTPTLLILGALSPEKRVDLAIDVVSHVPGAVLLVVGGGPERSRLAKQADTLGGGRVLFLGETSDVRGALYAADLMLLTSDSEGVPGVLIEAGLCGLPAVARAVGFVDEVVVDGVSGAVVDTTDPEDLSMAVRQTLDNHAARGDAAWKHCSQVYAEATVVGLWERLLHDVSRNDGTSPSR